MKLSDIINEDLRRVDGRWALVSKSNPDKVLQYYRGDRDQKPSKDWVNRVERRVHSFEDDDLIPSTELLPEAEYKGRKVTLNKPFRTPGGPRKFAVYVKNDAGNVVIVRFGDPNMEIKRDDPDRRRNFRARHNCDDARDRTTPRYWSCYQWRAGARVAEDFGCQDMSENISVTGTELAQQARKKNLVPGTDAWFKHWFSLPLMRREDFEFAKTELINYITEVRKKSCKR